jgi:hypothetical protein
MFSSSWISLDSEFLTKERVMRQQIKTWLDNMMRGESAEDLKTTACKQHLLFFSTVKHDFTNYCMSRKTCAMK